MVTASEVGGPAREFARARAREAALRRLVEDTSTARTPAEIARSTVEIAGDLLGADGAAVYTPVATAGQSSGQAADGWTGRDPVLEILHSAGWETVTADRFRRVEVRPGRPLSDAFLTGSAVWIEDAKDWRRRYPQMAEMGTAEGSQATACLPLRVGGLNLGAAVFSFSRPRTFQGDERDHLLAVAALCAQALDRCRIREAEAVARATVDLQLDRMTFLVRVNQMMDAPLSVERRMQRLADLAVPQIADWCAVHLVREGRVDQVAVAHGDPEKVAFVARLEQQYPPDPTTAGGAIDVSRTGVPSFVPEITDDLLVAAAIDATHLELIREIGMRSYVVVPLLARGRSVGALTLVQAESGRRFVDTDLSFVTQLATTAAVALDNARLYERQQQIAHTLQSALLPEAIPVSPGLEVVARYHPQSLDATTDVFVGGDVYDVVEGGGPTTSSRCWSAMVADVCGKGPDAAAVTALIRHTWRAGIAHGLRPRDVLASINTAMLRRSGRDRYRFATLVHARVTVDDDGATVTLVNGGHPPALLLRGSQVETVTVSGTALGIYRDLDVHEAEIRLGPGDALVLYTDGVIEARGDGFYGADRLRSVLSSCAVKPVDEIADTLMADVLAFQNGAAHDDIALMVLRARP